MKCQRTMGTCDQDEHNIFQNASHRQPESQTGTYQRTTSPQMQLGAERSPDRVDPCKFVGPLALILATKAEEAAEKSLLQERQKKLPNTKKVIQHVS